ncbi:hypothetical protein OIU79_001432 [Salix purpurea]|uniref:Uncharacterized protein n=1 Tax=Salix purpurea TaxID=77065 RepID=A0A9Q0ZH39_SALPP|nr:hypothetical protein OIU79_001432 [Salix purpurea]
MNGFALSEPGKMNFNNVKVPKVPGGGAIGTLIKIGVLGGLGLYGATNSLYNVQPFSWYQGEGLCYLHCLFIVVGADE